MASLNRVFLLGNLTRDPEIRYIPSGKAVADLQLAVNNRYKTAAGEWKEDPCFISVTAWERLAETAGEYLKKGSSVLVEGSLRYEKWESNGEKRSRHSVLADRIHFLDRIKRGADGAAAEPARREEAPPPPAGGAAEPPPADKAEAPPAGKADDDNLPF